MNVFKNVGLLVASTLTLGVFPSAAHASGQRGTVLTEAKIEGFEELLPDAFAQQSLHYAGSTAKWHVFMRVDTSTGGGMPFDHLSTYKVAVKAIEVVNGWTIRFSDRTIEANDCPYARPSKSAPVKWMVPAEPEARERCGT